MSKPVTITGNAVMIGGGGGGRNARTCRSLVILKLAPQAAALAPTKGPWAEPRYIVACDTP
jgi:hypothetical protein